MSAWNLLVFLWKFPASAQNPHTVALELSFTFHARCGKLKENQNLSEPKYFQKQQLNCEVALPEIPRSALRYLEGMSKVEEEEPVDPQILLPCHICFRTFRVESLERHSSICQVVATKKRKVFDSFKQRVQDLPDVPKSPHPATPTVRRSNSSLSVKAPSWKDNHIQLIKTVRAARTAEHTRCPYCERCVTSSQSRIPKSLDGNPSFRVENILLNWDHIFKFWNSLMKAFHWYPEIQTISFACKIMKQRRKKTTKIISKESMLNVSLKWRLTLICKWNQVNRNGWLISATPLFSCVNLIVGWWADLLIYWQELR